MKKLKIHPLFLLMAATLIAFGFGKIVFSAFVAIIVHEFGHALVAKRLGIETKNLILLPFGANLALKESSLSPKTEILIAIMGPVFSIVFAIAIIALWWLFPVTYSFTKEFVWANLSLFFVNLIPAFPLDGGRILWSVLSHNLSGKSSRKVVIWLNSFFAALFFVLFATSFWGSLNISFGFMCFFLIQGIFENKWTSEYGKLAFQFGKNAKQSDVVAVKTISVGQNTTILTILRSMSKTKVNQILVSLPNGKKKAMFDEQFDSICEKYPLETKLCDVFKIK